MNDKDENIDEIRRDIEDTRLRISTEIDAIEGKLTPEHAKDVLMEKVQETRHRVADKVQATGHRVADRIGGTAAMVRGRADRVGDDFGAAVRDNPIPVALIGIGAGWLVWETFRPERREILEIEVDVPPDDAPDYGVGVMGPVPESMRGGDGQRSERENGGGIRARASGLASNARERAHDAKDRASHVAQDARDRASHVAHDARDRASHLAHDAKERTRTIAHEGRERAMHARDRATESFDTSPLRFGAVALLAGVGLGLLLPHTRREDRALGPTRERVVTRARRIADDAKDVAVDSVREGFREGTQVARDTAKREAEERNLIR